MFRCSIGITLFLSFLALSDGFSPVGMTLPQTRSYQVENAAYSLTSLNGSRDSSNENTDTMNRKSNFFSEAAISTAMFLAISTSALPALAVSGGGLDYANLDITGQDFSNQKYKGKDFTQVRMFMTNFEMRLTKKKSEFFMKNEKYLSTANSSIELS